jgi:hypothetical protein
MERLFLIYLLSQLDVGLTSTCSGESGGGSLLVVLIHEE